MWPNKAAVVWQDNLELQNTAVLLRKASCRPLYYSILVHCATQNPVRTIKARTKNLHIIPHTALP